MRSQMRARYCYVDLMRIFTAAAQLVYSPHPPTTTTTTTLLYFDYYVRVGGPRVSVSVCYAHSKSRVGKHVNNNTHALAHILAFLVTIMCTLYRCRNHI